MRVPIMDGPFRASFEEVEPRDGYAIGHVRLVARRGVVERYRFRMEQGETVLRHEPAEESPRFE